MQQLLPASAAAFAPRASSINVVLGSKVEHWLTETLKRVSCPKRPLNSVSQHQQYLTETLSSEKAIWNLVSMLVAKFPEAKMPTNESERLYECYEMLHIEAYIVCVDMVLRNEVIFKLTTNTIKILIKYHKEIHCPDVKASTAEYTGKDQQLEQLHDDYIQDINKFVYPAPASALEGLEEEGTGELLCGLSAEVKTILKRMLKPLVPPPAPVKAPQAFEHYLPLPDLWYATALIPPLEPLPTAPLPTAYFFYDIHASTVLGRPLYSMFTGKIPT